MSFRPTLKKSVSFLSRIFRISQKCRNIAKLRDKICHFSLVNDIKNVIISSHNFQTHFAFIVKPKKYPTLMMRKLSCSVMSMLAGPFVAVPAWRQQPVLDWDLGNQSFSSQSTLDDVRQGSGSIASQASPISNQPVDYNCTSMFRQTNYFSSLWMRWRIIWNNQQSVLHKGSSFTASAGT